MPNATLVDAANQVPVGTSTNPIYVTGATNALNPFSYVRSANNAFAVTPHDSTNFTNNADYLYVGTGGNVVVVDVNDGVTTFTAVPSGGIIPIRAKRVNSTSTTASNIVGMFYS